MDEQRHEGATSGPLVAVADPGIADGHSTFDTQLGLLTLVMRLVEAGPSVPWSVRWWPIVAPCLTPHGAESISCRA